MCEPDLTFMLKKKKSINRNGERDESGESNQRKKEVMAMDGYGKAVETIF